MISDLATLMELAEAEQKSFLEKDRTEGGTELHPQVQAMLQVRAPEASMFAAPDEKLESPHGEPEPDADSV